MKCWKLLNAYSHIEAVPELDHSQTAKHKQILVYHKPNRILLL